MTTWKEKASMWGMKVAMAIVVGAATVVKPAMNAVFDYKERWRANEDKELFARLKNVFDNADIPLSNIKTLNEMITTNKKPVECHMCGKVKELCDCCNKEMSDTLTNLFKVANDGGLDKHISKALENLAKKLDRCQCCDCLEDCFCMDCPVHPTYRSKAIITDTPKQDTVCCGCIGTDHCETCPVHGKTEIGGEVINDLRTAILEVEKTIEAKPEQKVDRKRAIVLVDDIVKHGLFENDRIAIEDQVEEIMKWNETTFGNMRHIVDQLSLPKNKTAAEARADSLATDMQVEIAKMDANAKKAHAKSFEELSELAELQVSMSNLVASMGGSTQTLDSSLDKFIEMGPGVKEALDNSHWKRNYDMAYERIHDNTKAAKQANKKKPAKKTKVKTKTTKTKKTTKAKKK